MNRCLSLWAAVKMAGIYSLALWHARPTKMSMFRQLTSERGEQQGDYALLVALVVVAALALLFIVGPQVAMVYAQSVQSGTGTP